MMITILVVGIVVVLALAWFWIQRSENARIETPSGNGTTQTPAEAFDRTGNLVRNNPGLEAGMWYLIYEAPGLPALTQRLIFTTSSTCVQEGVESLCNMDAISQGQRARVFGEMRGESVIVTRLEVEE